jgi:hypothetical protein
LALTSAAGRNSAAAAVFDKATIVDLRIGDMLIVGADL